jgi:hypothetical protein
MYGSTEETARRLAIWNTNKLIVDEHNAAEARGEFTFRLAMNKLADLEVRDSFASDTH